MDVEVEPSQRLRDQPVESRHALRTKRDFVVPAVARTDVESMLYEIEFQLERARVVRDR